MQKKILILGGAKNQVALISKARELGYYVVLCDWTTTNPGIPFADKHYQVSTLDRAAVLKVARHENVSGVMSNSEPAMPNVSYIAHELGLVGTSEESVLNLISKDRFRKVQREAGAFAPRIFTSDNRLELMNQAKVFPCPFIVKPTMNSGSKGTLRFDHYDAAKANQVIASCLDCSWNHQCSIEEFVELPVGEVLDGEVFVCNGRIIWDGLFVSSRRRRWPIPPGAQFFPLVLSDAKWQIAKDTLTKIFSRAGVTFGEYNVEMYFTKYGELFVIEINCRQGGTFIPEKLHESCGIDFSRLLLSTAMGDNSYLDSIPETNPSRYIIHCPIDTEKDGRFVGVDLDESIKPYLLRSTLKVKVGDAVKYASNAHGLVGWMAFEFPNYELQCKYWRNVDEYVHVNVVD